MKSPIINSLWALTLTISSTIRTTQSFAPIAIKLQKQQLKNPPSIFMASDSDGDDTDDEFGGNFFDEISDATKDDTAPTTSSMPVTPTESYAVNPEEFEAHIPKINSITITGRIGQTPEPRYFDDGKVVLRLSLAVKRKYHPLERMVRNIKYGEEETDWFNLELWGRDAEYAGKFVTKGARVGVTGSMNVDTYTDRMSGEERNAYKVLVKHLDILETKAEADARLNRSSGGGYSSNQYGGNSYGGNNYGSGGNSDSTGDGPSSAGTGGFFDDN